MGRTPLRTACATVLAIVVVLQVAGRVVYRERLPRDRSAFRLTEVEQRTRAGSNPRQLVVIFHGLGGRSMTGVRSVTRDVLPDADVMVPSYSSSALSNEQPIDIVREYLSAIDRAAAAVSYDKITFVGYSAGALLARKTLVCAYTGCADDFEGMERPRPWRSRVDRLVLLAGMNRGWATHCEKVVAVQQAGGVGYDNDCRASRMRWVQWVGAELGERFAPAFGVGGLALALERGQPFVANLRLDWLELVQREQSLPPVVQLLGDIDELVSRSDTLDQFVSNDFVFVQLHDTNHANVVEMESPAGAERRQRFAEALTWPIGQLRAVYPPPPNPDYTPDPAVRRVVMIVHGIRDDGRWANDLGRDFQTADSHVRSFSRSYGYFSALYFLMPTRMEANVRWFVDQYTQLRALYPQADIDFIGHSNGTYMLAQAVAKYHAVRFNKVIFAGSVVQTGFPWARFRARVQAVRNYRASDDRVVAALPSVFEHIPGFLAVGGAGHAGFTDDFARSAESPYFAKGGHDAVLGDRRNYSPLVNYILGRDGCAVGVMPCEPYELPADNRATKQSIVAVLLFRFTVIVWAAGIMLVGVTAYAAARAVGPNGPRRTPGEHLLRSVAAGVAVVATVLIVLRYV